MVPNSTLTELFKSYVESDTSPIIELLNIDGKPVGAIYSADLKYTNFVVSETNNSEKYYLYANGIGIYFSFYKRIGV